MHFRRAILASLIAAAAWSAEGASKPWSDSFSMELRGESRTFVTLGKTSYLVAIPADFDDIAFVDSKDIMLETKVERADKLKASLYKFPQLSVVSEEDVWGSSLTDTNVYLFGKITVADGKGRYLVTAVFPAPSDAEIIAVKLQAVPKDDFAGRLAVAAWARDAANHEGNGDFWAQAADTITGAVVDDAAKKASEAKDVTQLLEVMGWCVDLLRDPNRAGNLASQPWVAELPAKDTAAIKTRMRKLNFESYNGVWKPQTEKLTLEFNERFAAIKWKDAESYYKLGRWAEANGDLLPRASELAHQCYQAGFKADPENNSIRRELGLEPVVRSAGGKGGMDSKFSDPSLGLVIAGPDKWTRSEPIEGDLTWIDPTSDTAFISVKIMHDEEVPDSFEDLFTSATSDVKKKDGFVAAETGNEEVKHAQCAGRRMRGTYQEGHFTRTCQLVVLKSDLAPVAVAIFESATEAEQPAAEAALNELLTRLTFAKPEEAPATEPATRSPAGGAKPPAAGKGPGQPATGNPAPAPTPAPGPASGPSVGPKPTQPAAPGPTPGSTAPAPAPGPTPAAPSP